MTISTLFLFSSKTTMAHVTSLSVLGASWTHIVDDGSNEF